MLDVAGPRPTDVDSVAFMDGEWWYMGQADGRRRVDGHRKKNHTRMFVNGTYVSKSHPLHRPGSYKSWDDAWSHKEIEEKTKAGDLYILINPSFPGWCKVGKAMDAADRAKNYQTASPFRDYSILFKKTFKNRHEIERVAHRILRKHAKDTRGEWFQIPPQRAVMLLENLPECN